MLRLTVIEKYHLIRYKNVGLELYDLFLYGTFVECMHRISPGLVELVDISCQVDGDITCNFNMHMGYHTLSDI